MCINREGRAIPRRSGPGAGWRAAGWWAPFLVLVLMLASAPFARAGTGEARIDAYLAGLSSLQAEFEQYTFNAERTRMLEARGTFYLQRPGRFRWAYETPDKKLIIADGSRVYLHDLELKQVSHQSQQRALRGTPALLLADERPIGEHFQVRAIPSSDGRDWFELIPRDTESDIQRLELGFSGTELDSLIMEDGFGQSTRLNFSRIQRNLALDPSLFRIDPRAVDDFLSFE